MAAFLQRRALSALASSLAARGWSVPACGAACLQRRAPAKRPHCRRALLAAEFLG